MKLNDYIVAWANRDTGHAPRQVGRYYASELYKIEKGYLKPSNYFDKRAIDEEGAHNILEGVMSEDALTKVFTDMKVDVKCQDKTEIQIDEEVVIVTKPDFVFPQMVYEVKSPQERGAEIIRAGGIPPWYCNQLEAYYRSYYKSIFFCGVLHTPLHYKQIEYTPSKGRWNAIIDSVMEFHSKLKAIEAKKKLRTVT